MAGAKSYEIAKREVVDAFERVKAKGGGAGADGVTLVDFEKDLRGNLYRIWNRLSSGSYFPPPVKRVEVQEEGGKIRPLGIPTVGDRIAQMVVKQRLEPELEPLFDENSYGYRPGRSAHDALKVARRLCWKHDWVLDLDIKGFFDNLDWSLLMKAVRKHAKEAWVTLYIQRWLGADVILPDGTVQKRDRGTPQGGVISPLLANLYMNRFLKHWRTTGRGEAFRAAIVNYADDFVILSRGRAAEALAWTRDVMTRLGLSINEAKTSVRDAQQERFDFLGYTFGPHIWRKNGRRYLGASPSRKSVQRLKDKIGGVLVPGNVAPWPEVRDQLNSMLRGWSQYFSYGTRMSAYKTIDHHVHGQVSRFLVRRHKVAGRGTRTFPVGMIRGKLGVLALRPLLVTRRGP